MSETLRIERMGYGADAVGRLEGGKTVFVEGGAPGDLAEVEVVEEKPNFCRARIVGLQEASPLRAKDAQPQVGAPWAHLSYQAQLDAKRENVVGALVHTAHFDQARAEELVKSCLPSKREWGYRNKIELNAKRDAQGRFCLGFEREGTHELVTPKSYPIAHAPIAKVCTALQGSLRYAQGSQDLGIHRVSVRHSQRTGELEVALWTTPGAFPRAMVAKTLGSAVHGATSIVRVLADPGPARKIKGVEVLSGKGRWREELSGFSFEVTAPSFFQVNTEQAEKLVAEVVRALGGGVEEDEPYGLDDLCVADLYSGCGTFSIPLSWAGAEVVAVESASSSVRDLRRNAEENQVFVDVVGGDAARELPTLEGADALVVDPPRSGLAPEVIEGAAKLGPKRVVYVSCDPPTWARDMGRFEASGYALDRVQPVDLFPQTYHVELVSVLRRA